MRQRKTLRERKPDSKPRERAGPGGNSHNVDLTGLRAARLQQPLHHDRQPLRVNSAEVEIHFGEDTFVFGQSGATDGCGRFHRQEFHRVASPFVQRTRISRSFSRPASKNADR